MSEFGDGHLSQWWLPQLPERAAAGRALITPEKGILIETAGDLESEWAPFEQPGPIGRDTLARRSPIIHGRLSNGTAVTLARCIQSSMSLPGIGSGPRYSSYVAELAYVGQHFATEDDAIFTSLVLEYPQLVDWVGSSLKTLSPPRADRDRTTSAVEYDHGVLARLNLNGLNLILRTDVTMQIKVNRSVQLVESCHIEVLPVSARSYAELLPIVFRINCLLTLCLGSSVAPKKTRGLPVEARDNMNPELRSALGRVDIVQSERPDDTSEKPRHLYEQLVPWPKIAPKLDKTFASHFAAFEQLEPAYQMYFATLRRSDLYLEHTFLSIMMALETYDRCRRGGKYIDDGEWDRLRPPIEAHIPAEADDDLRESITTRLKYANEYSLRQRLRCLAEEWVGLFDFFRIDTKRWVDLVTDTRNKLVHESRIGREDVAVAGGLHGLVQSLRALTEALLLTEIGLNRDEAIGLIRDSARFSSLHGVWKPVK
jgi:hypothetical protein